MRNWLDARPVRAGLPGLLATCLVLTGCGAFLTAHYRIERAQREIKEGKWQAAAFDLRAVLHKDAHNARAWVLLTRVALDTANTKGATTALNRARAAGAPGPQIDALQARVWLAAGKPQALLNALRHQTIKLPEPDATVMFARAQLASGHPDKAVARIEPLVARHPALAEAQVVLAESLLQEGQVGQALKVVRTAGRLDPKSPRLLVLAGRIDAMQGRFRAEQQTLEQALARMPPSTPLAEKAMALIGLTEARLALGKTEAAAQSQYRLATLAPRAPITQLLDARIKLARKDLLGGTSELYRVVLNAPDFLPARVALGESLLQRGDLEQAEQQLQRVIVASPDDLQARGLLAQVQLKLGQPAAASTTLIPVLRAPNPDARLLTLLSEAVRRSGTSTALREALTSDQREEPHDDVVTDNVAAVYLRVGQADRALLLLEKTRDSGDLRRVKLLLRALLAVRGPAAVGQKVDALLGAHPNDPRFLELAAAYAVSQNQLQRARTLLQRAVSLDPNDARRLIALAEVEEAGGDVTAAEHRLSAALAAHPDVQAYRLALAGALTRARSFAQARKVLEAAGDAHSLPAVQFALARVALAQGNLAEANAALDRAIADRPGRTSMVVSAGLLLMQAHHDTAALERFTRATAMEPDNALYWLDRARAELALGRLSPARLSLERAAHLQPRWLRATSMLALIDLRQGDGRGALSRVDALLAKEPNGPGALELKGDVEFALHHAAAALTAYTEAQQLRPSGVLAVKLYQGRVATHAADPSQPLKEWLKRQPTDWHVRTVLANYDLQVAHARQAGLRELREVVRQEPDDVLALNNLAWALRRTGDPQARSLAERAYRLAPQSAAVNDTLGWILMHEGNGAQALPYVERASRLAPSDPQIAYHYAYVLAKMGRRAEAQKILSRALAGSGPFDSRREAKRLLATLRAMIHS